MRVINSFVFIFFISLSSIFSVDGFVYIIIITIPKNNNVIDGINKLNIIISHITTHTGFASETTNNGMTAMKKNREK